MSYVVAQGRAERDEPDERERAERLRIRALGRFGEEVVRAYEEDVGRHAELLPGNHPGYDIVSSDSIGNVRYIEVKTTTSWNGTGVGLTTIEWKTAYAHKEKYWLYVLDLSPSDSDPAGGGTLYGIQDPGGKAEKFMLDDGWKAVAAFRTRVEAPRQAG